MPDLLLFAESLFIWQLVNYARYPVCDDETPAERGKSSVRSGFSRLIDAGSRSLAAALLVLAADGFRRTGYLPAAIVFIGSLLLPAVRRRISAVSLAEFELVANALVALLLWFVCVHLHAGTVPLWLPRFNSNRMSALCICAALFIYAIRGGSYLVRGILAKAGGMLPPAPVTAESYTHGRLIGQVERAIVILIVMAGNLQALAFFFAAKGLIRSRELDSRSRVDYLLLGSLSSFLIALAAGLVEQRTMAALWK